jgi:hypothetical protein
MDGRSELSSLPVAGSEVQAGRIEIQAGRAEIKARHDQIQIQRNEIQMPPLPRMQVYQWFIVDFQETGPNAFSP